MTLLKVTLTINCPVVDEKSLFGMFYAWGISNIDNNTSTISFRTNFCLQSSQSAKDCSFMFSHFCLTQQSYIQILEGVEGGENVVQIPI